MGSRRLAAQLNTGTWTCQRCHQVCKMTEGDADIALIGLAVMGQNLILNMNDHGFKVVAYNRTTSKVDDFLNNEAKGTNVVGAHSLEEMVGKLKRPRRVMILVKAGAAVDAFIDKLVPLLEKGDIIIDGGNSEYQDSQRRTTALSEKGILFVGSGVSGGEEGARYGPSLMPGGNPAAWPAIKPIFQAICAKSGEEPCCDWVGDEGSGHFVKMVHNGIEYGDMQLIAEAYHLMKDAAGQKGTGKWTAISALDHGMPVTLIAESVFARCLSSLKDERIAASKVLQGPPAQAKPKISAENKMMMVEKIRKALYASKIVSYAQGFMLLREAAKNFGWKLNYGGIALMWRGGCIIRSAFLGKIKSAFDSDPEIACLLLDGFFRDAIHSAQAEWRSVVSYAVQCGVPTPCFSTALAFYDGYRSERLPANLIQAQRDYFGAHTYELLSNPGKFVHTNWTGTGGNVSASTYDA